MRYCPDKWVLLEIIPENGKKFYKVMGGWQGSYASSDSWRLNSGITSVSYEDCEFLLHGHSGSVYKCYKQSYGLTSLMINVLHSFLTQQTGIRLLDKEEAWATLKAITTTV